MGNRHPINPYGIVNVHGARRTVGDLRLRAATMFGPATDHSDGCWPLAVAAAGGILAELSGSVPPRGAYYPNRERDGRW